MVPDALLANCSSLRELTLLDTQASDVSFTSQAPSLARLRVINAPRLVGANLTASSNLTVLELDNTGLASFDGELFPSLESLRLASSPNTTNVSLAGMDRLQQLELAFLPLSALPSLPPGLQELRVTSNHAIAGLDQPDILANLTTLILGVPDLVLRENHFADMPQAQVIMLTGHEPIALNALVTQSSLSFANVGDTVACLNASLPPCGMPPIPSAAVAHDCSPDMAPRRECTVSCRPGFSGAPVTFRCDATGAWTGHIFCLPEPPGKFNFSVSCNRGEKEGK
jgi:hypothetical protein